MLQDKPGVDDIALEMNKDILRLQTIAERFSKIGSQPELSKQDITKVLKRSFNYMKDRSSAKVIYEQNIKRTQKQLTLKACNNLLAAAKYQSLVQL